MATKGIPLPPKPKTAKPKASSSASTNTTKATTKPAAGGSSGAAKDPYAAALAKQNAKEKKANKKASQKLITQAKNLQGQIDAIKVAVGDKGFKNALTIALGNIGRSQEANDRLLVEGYETRVGSLRGATSDNEKAAGDTTYQNLANRARERANAISQAALQGAGESDMLQSQMMSLRNWEANQGEINRGYFDTLRSINSSLADLNVDTKSARINNVMEANAERGKMYSNYYSQLGEAYTQLGNTKLEQATLYGNANEAKGGKKTKKLQKQAAKKADDFFMKAAEQTGNAYTEPAIPAALTNWQGEAAFQGQQGTSVFDNALTNIATKKPEGSKLRAW